MSKLLDKAKNFAVNRHKLYFSREDNLTVGGMFIETMADFAEQEIRTLNEHIGLGDQATQRAWMAYADANDIPHDHEDETPFKCGFNARKGPYYEGVKRTCNACAHSDNAHNDGSNELRECFDEDCNCKTFVDSGCNACPFCGHGAWIIQCPSASGGNKVVYSAHCVNEECAAEIAGCATKKTAQYLWNQRL